MEANGGGDGLADGEDHAQANGGGGALANGGDHALGNGGGGALANGGDHALANGGGGALANGVGHAPAVEAGGPVENEGLNQEQAMVAANGVAPPQAVAQNGVVGPDHAAAAADASMGNPVVLYLAFLRLPAQEVARCRTFCRLWRDITGTEAFRHDHRNHRWLVHRRHHLCRTPTPLFFFQGPDPARVNLCAVDIRDRVTRPVLRFTRPLNHGEFRIHGSSAGVLLLSSGNRLYACNPYTRRWARLPALHVHHDIIGFYNRADSGWEVLYHDRVESECEYWFFRLDNRTASWIGRPVRGGYVEVDLVLANGIRPSYQTPPVRVIHFLHWLPQAGQDNTNIIMFDTASKDFYLIPPPTITVLGEEVPVAGGQLFEIVDDTDERLAMAVITPTRGDVWVRSNTNELWSRHYHIQLPVDVISLNGGYRQDGTLNVAVFAVAQDRNMLVQCPRVLLQCDALGAVLRTYQLAEHRTFLSRHTIQESLRLHTSILPRDAAVDGDPPFFPQNQ